MSHYSANTGRSNDERSRSRRSPISRPPFSVSDMDVAVAATLLDGMTITGTPSPSVRTGASLPISSSSTAPWAIVQHPVITMPSSGGRGDLSVITAQTQPSGLTGGLMFGSGGGGGGRLGDVTGGVFNALHAHSKMPHNNTGVGKFKLLPVVRDTGICLGFVGLSKEIVCVNQRCPIVNHKRASNKWDPPAELVLLIPAVKQGKSHTAFVTPGSFVVGDHLPQWMVSEAESEKTLKAWVEEFIPRAQEAARDHIPRIAEEDEDEEDLGELYETNFDTEELVTEFVWDDIQDEDYAAFIAEEEVNESEDGPFAKELRGAIVQVRGHLASARAEARQDVDRIARVVATTNKWLIEALTPINARSKALRRDVGDMAEFEASYSLTSVSDGLLFIFSEFEEAKRKEFQHGQDLQGRIDELGEDFGVVDDNVIKIGSVLPTVMNEVSTLQNRVRVLEGISSPGMVPTAVGLNTSSPVTDDATGMTVITLGQMIIWCENLTKENARLRSEIGGQGGVSVGTFSFASIQELEDLVTAELPAGGIFPFELFVDLNTLSCHNSNFDPGNSMSSIEWSKATKDMVQKGYSDAARKTVRVVNEPVSALYSGGKEAIAGSVIASFKTAGTWTGERGRDGQRHKIEEKINTAKMTVNASINGRLPVGSKLQQLAFLLVDLSVTWYVELHRHLDNDLQRLTQMGLEKEAVLVLLSEEIIILFTLVHNVRKKGQEFSASTDPKTFMVQWIWLTLECHSAMEAEIKNGISSSGAINSAFVRFLTNQLAVMSKSGGGGGDSKWDAWRTKWEGKINDAVAAAGQAKADAKGSLSESGSSKTAIEKLFTKNPTLKR